MLPEVSVVVLGKYNEVFDGFRMSAELHIANYQKVLVRDGTDIPWPKTPNWIQVQGPPEFSMAGNANLGWKAVNPEHDILYTSDDVRFDTPNPIILLSQAAYSDHRFGIVSPRINGASCNKVQTDATLTHIKETADPLAFICIYIKRELINKIGMLDEEFNEYGYDDWDYCRRARIAGYRLAVTPFARVIHWGDAHATFARNPTWPVEKNREYYKRKWGEA